MHIFGPQEVNFCRGPPHVPAHPAHPQPRTHARTQVGAVIVNGDQVILGIGYNGFPRGCCDSDLPWAKVCVRA